VAAAGQPRKLVVDMPAPGSAAALPAKNLLAVLIRPRLEVNLTRTRAAVALVLWLLVTLAAGQLGSLLGGDAQGELYRQLERPAWAPPGWLFAPVWIVLYLLLGTAAWLVWRERGFAGARWPLTLFLVHLLFNAAWTGIFFGLRMFGLALVEIVVLWALILWLTVLFWRARPLAGVLMLPYLLWVSYAVALNYALWRMNP
jgi:translocator protein